ncbi:hypothetical protein MCAV_07300 [[Mycoplasma] cavipharyngis]|uniref:hypothetical protein n=1 Tax=[Mycoplasma] cavipharyngis TaxID=92757 RepID=UPI0037042038
MKNNQLDYIKSYLNYHDAMLDSHLAEKQLDYPAIELKQIFILGTYYAYQLINEKRYQSYINKYEHREILSYVYFAFNYAIKHFRWEQIKSLNAFKNYFFRLINFYTMQEFKITTNWKVVNNYKKLQKDENNYLSWPKLIETDAAIAQQKIAIIKSLLKNHKPLYLKIIEGKLAGYSSHEIAKINHVSYQTVKRSFDYIKKIIRKKYQSINDVKLNK